MSLAKLTWPDLDQPRRLLVLPAGSTEQHGPHLPLGTDTMVAEALAAELVKGGSDRVLAPPLSYGSSGEHAGFAGTLSVGRPALEGLVVELVRSADHFSGTIIVSGHGGNLEPLTHAAAQLTQEGRRVLLWSPRSAVVSSAWPAWGGALASDAHAGAVETSLMLHLHPDLVRAPLPSGGSTTALAELLPVLQRHGVASVSPSGVLGDPSLASAEAGAAIFSALAADLGAVVAAWGARLVHD
jgi:mycofactocin system creatininase family protein